MPTSARKVRGQSGWLIRIIPPVLPVRSRGDVGIAPYAKGGVKPFNGARPNTSGVPSTPGPGSARSTLSKQERALGVAPLDHFDHIQKGIGQDGDALQGS